MTHAFRCFTTHTATNNKNIIIIVIIIIFIIIILISATALAMGLKCQQLRLQVERSVSSFTSKLINVNGCLIGLIAV